MQFGLANAQVMFQVKSGEVLRDLLDRGVVVYIDDILVYLETQEEYDRLVLEVSRRLEENGLAVAPEKFHWSQSEVEFLDYI
jgi:hypothetical protein